MEDILGNISERLSRFGARAAFLSIDRLSHIQKPYRDYQGREEDLDFFNRYLKKFLIDYSKLMPEARSIITIAYPQKITEIVFSSVNQKISTLIPPTYIYHTPEKDISLAMKQAIKGSPYKIKGAILPKKLTAALSGLGRYGKNNLIYVRGMGSFAYLSTYLTDIKADVCADNPMPALESCQQCYSCIENCPSGCLSRQGFNFKPYRCLTYLNENEGMFPDWIDNKWHNAIVGCMKCQIVCPQNRDMVNHTEKGPEFRQHETEAIVKGSPFEQLPADTRQKLSLMCMDDYYDLLARNLKALINSQITG